VSVRERRASSISKLGIIFPNMTMRRQRSILDYFSSNTFRQTAHQQPSASSSAHPIVPTEQPAPTEDIFEGQRKEIVAFTDGSCIKRGNSQKVGWATVFPFHQSFDRKGKLRGRLETINRAEYTAFIEAIKASNEINPDQSVPLIVYSDSELLVKTVNLWMRSWKQAGWIKHDKRPVKNLDLLVDIDHLMHQKRKIHIFHVRAHQKIESFYSKWNNLADKLAKEAACAE
jgi:ribonuclease HI